MPKVGGDDGIVVAACLSVGIHGGNQRSFLRFEVAAITKGSQWLSKARLKGSGRRSVIERVMLFENNVQGPCVFSGSVVFVLYKSALQDITHRRADSRGSSSEGGNLTLVLMLVRVGKVSCGGTCRFRYRCRFVVVVATEGTALLRFCGMGDHGDCGR